MFDINSVLPLLTEHVHKLPSEDQDDILLFCPFCNDRAIHDHGHMYLSKSTGYFNCFFCGRGGKNPLPLLEAYGVSLSYLDRIKYQLTPAIDISYQNGIMLDDKPNDLLVDFQNNSQNVPIDSEGYKYLEKRGISSNDINRYWRVWNRCPGYVFWFVTDKESNVVFYTGRAYVKGLKRYNNSKNTNTPIVLFHENTFIPTPTFSGKSLLFIVEGVFDAFFAPGPSVPLLAKRLSSISSDRLKKVIQVNNFAPVCCLDKLEIEDNLKLATTLSSWANEVYLFKLSPYKDFGQNKLASLDNKGIHERLIPYLGHNKNIIKYQLSS